MIAGSALPTLLTGVDTGHMRRFVLSRVRSSSEPVDP
jgi:hypothetical protein